MEVERDAIQAPDAIAFMTEFSQNATIFNGLLLPVLAGSVGLLVDHDIRLSNLETSFSEQIDPMQTYLGRLGELELAADAVILAAEALAAQGADNPEWQEDIRIELNTSPKI